MKAFRIIIKARFCLLSLFFFCYVNSVEGETLESNVSQWTSYFSKLPNIAFTYILNTSSDANPLLNSTSSVEYSSCGKNFSFVKTLSNASGANVRKRKFSFDGQFYQRYIEEEDYLGLSRDSKILSLEQFSELPLSWPFEFSTRGLPYNERSTDRLARTESWISFLSEIRQVDVMKSKEENPNRIDYIRNINGKPATYSVELEGSAFFPMSWQEKQVDGSICLLKVLRTKKIRSQNNSEITIPVSIIFQWWNAEGGLVVEKSVKIPEETIKVDYSSIPGDFTIPTSEVGRVYDEDLHVSLKEERR